MAIIAKPNKSLFRGVQSLTNGYKALINHINELEDEQLIELYFYLDEIGSLNWKAKCACLWEAFQRLKKRKFDYTQKDVTNLGREFHLAQSTVYQYISVWETFFAGSNILEWQISEYNFFRLALSAPNPVEALQHAEEERVANRNYTLRDFKSYVVGMKREQKLDSAIIPNVEKNKQVIHGDALEVLPTVESNLVDCIITDPPTEIGESYSELNEFSMSWLTQAHRILKDSGSIFVIGNRHNIFNIGHTLATVGFSVLADIAWIKEYTHERAVGGIIPLHNIIIWATKSPDYNQTKRFGAIQDVWKISGEHKFGHPEEKPEALLEKIITIGTDPGQLILDPFAGSGTTLAVAKKLKRQFIGIEKDKRYYKLILSRLQK